MDIRSAALPPLAALQPLPPLSQASVQGETPAMAGGTFQQILGQVLQPIADSNAKADAAIQALATGEADDLHTVSLAVAQADLAFRMLLELRNRLTEAYQEVMRMQV
jgi:flagellar hook-basal body complex protein FliE